MRGRRRSKTTGQCATNNSSTLTAPARHTYTGAQQTEERGKEKGERHTKHWVKGTTCENVA